MYCCQYSTYCVWFLLCYYQLPPLPSQSQLLLISNIYLGFPESSVVKNPPDSARRPGLDPWVGKIPWRRRWQLTPKFLPGKSHGQRSLAGSSPWGHKRIKHHLATKTTKQYLLGTYFPWHYTKHILSIVAFNIPQFCEAGTTHTINEETET